MNDKPLNMFNALDLLTAEPPPVPQPQPQPRSGGRRETRLEVNKSKRLIFQAKGMHGGVTAPIARKQPKRPAGMTAKEWKRARRVAREEQQQRQEADNGPNKLL